MSLKNNINLEKIIENISSFKKVKIGVIGDLILDKFIYGNVTRISPEAPVPIVHITKELTTPGGAGNVANNISSLLGKPYIVGSLGKDIEAMGLRQNLIGCHIDCNGVIESLDKHTIVKTRVIGQGSHTGGQHILRIDKETTEYISKQDEAKVLQNIHSQIESWDVIILSDYIKGFLTPYLIKSIIELANFKRKVVVADTKPKHIEYYNNVSVITPNDKEAFEISGVDDVIQAGKIIQKRLQCDVVLTQGSMGMSIFKKEKIKHLPTQSKEVYDVSGAGDTVISVIGLCLGVGLNLFEAGYVANHAAGIVVGKIGTSSITPEELITSLKS